MPTLLELVLEKGAEDLVEPIAGRSLVPLMAGELRDWFDEAVSEILFEGVRAPGLMIRRGSKKYVHWEGRPCSLFDLAEDPFERNNLVDWIPTRYYFSHYTSPILSTTKSNHSSYVIPTVPIISFST